uniref:Secreted protein n=1 Tax=Anguilla anguilla TaxID=7936 RepID=A0A0E9WIN4_ANGAN
MSRLVCGSVWLLVSVCEPVSVVWLCGDCSAAVILCTCSLRWSMCKSLCCSSSLTLSRSCLRTVFAL